MGYLFFLLTGMTLQIELLSEENHYTKSYIRLEALCAHLSNKHRIYSRQYNMIHTLYKDNNLYSHLKFDSDPEAHFSFYPDLITDLLIKKICRLDKAYVDLGFISVPRDLQTRIDSLEHNMEVAIDQYCKYNDLRKIEREELIRKRKLIHIESTFSDYLKFNTNVPQGNRQSEHITRLVNHGIESQCQQFIENTIQACVKAGYLAKKPRFKISKVKLYTATQSPRILYSGLRDYTEN